MTPEAQKSIDELVKFEEAQRNKRKIREAAAAKVENNKGYWEKFKDKITSTPVVNPQYGKDPLNRNLTEAEKLAMAARGGAK